MVTGDTVKTFKFIDEETQLSISMDLSVRDGIFLKLLERIASQIEKLRLKE